MNLEFYTTRDKILQKYIEGYYFISENQNSAPFHYWTFPNNFFILSVNQNTEICMEQRKLIIKSSLEENIVADYVASYSKPIEVSYVNPVNEMTFYFKHSFYDQSHFIKDFKQFTNISPNTFFQKVDTSKENIWLFI